MAKKIYLSPSDQTSNKYAYGGTTEAIQCRKIADACEVALLRCGFEVKNNQTSPMEVRVKESNDWGADLHVPIHTNAYNKKVAGTRIFCWNKTGEGHKASMAVYGVLAPFTPGKSENITVNKTLYEIRVPKAASVYIEVDFHDVADVGKWLIENAEEIGEKIAEGICKHYGVTYIPKPVEKPVEEPKKLYRIQVGSYVNKANAEKKLAEVKAAGFADAFIKAETV